MTEPRIQYAQTMDGVSIAFYALGHGPAIVRMPGIPWGHFQLVWQTVPDQRAVAEAAATRFTYVEFDSRGSGSSTREVSDFSLDAHALDLEAVVDQLGLENFALIGGQNSGPVAIAYAARNPQRVSHLILMNSFARYSDVLATPEGQTFDALRGKDWTIYTETATQILTGWSGAAAREAAARIRETASQEVALAAYKEIEKFDVTGLLTQIQVPTLVVHGTAVWPPVEFSRSLAAQIPGARLVVAKNPRGTLSAITEFLTDDSEQTKQDEDPAALGGFATILFTDMASSTTLADQLGDAAVQDVRRAHNDIVRAALGEHDGREIKHTGDGIMASFPVASGALACSIAIQRAVAAHVEEHTDTPLAVYIGLNAGEPIAEEDDLFGTSVDLAKRICDHAKPGQIVAADVVRQLAAGKDFLFADLGETELRGFEDPVPLYQVRWEE